MQTQSNEQLPRFSILGPTLTIHFNELEKVNREGEVSFHYDTVKIDKNSDRDERIECIIRCRYPTYGTEIAAMRKDPDAFEVFVQFAKDLADESLV